MFFGSSFEKHEPKSLDLGHQKIQSVSEQYVNIYVNFVKAKSWINLNRNWGRTKVERRQLWHELKNKAGKLFRP